MKILICPVSGGGFALQAGICESLCTIGYVPDLAMGSSGGNLVNKICLAGNWTPQGIRRVTANITQDFFISSWCTGLLSFIPSYVAGLFRESWFNSSLLGVQFFKDLFNKHTITTTELWTGTVHCKTKKTQLFCNRSQETSLVNKYCHDTCTPNVDKCSWHNDNLKHYCRTYGILPPIYLDGEVETIGKVALASASIPTIVPSLQIGEDPEGKYSDGGVTHASPLMCMKDMITNLEEINNPGLHLTYISSFDLDKDDPVSKYYQKSVHNGKITMLQVINNLCIQDRLSGVDLVRHPDLKLNYTEGVTSAIKPISVEDPEKEPENLGRAEYSIADKQTFIEMKKIETQRLKCRRSMIEYYPVYNTLLDLSHFDGDDIWRVMDQTRGHLGYRLWWLGAPEMFDGLSYTKQLR